MARASQEDKILQAALESFAERGYDGTRIRHIADRAGVAESALYRHYPSKEAIAQTLFERYLKAFLGQLQAIEAEQISVEEKLRKLAKSALADYRSNSAAISFILSHSQPLPAGLESPISVIARVIADGQQQGLIREGAPGLLATVFAGCFIQPIVFGNAPLFKTAGFEIQPQDDDLIADLAWAMLAKPPNL